MKVSIVLKHLLYGMIHCKAKNANGEEVVKSINCIVEGDDSLTITKVSNTFTKKFTFGKSIKLTTIAQGKGTINYRFVVLKNNVNVYTRGYNSKSYATWKPTEAGQYVIYYFVKDDSGNTVHKTETITIPNK